MEDSREVRLHSISYQYFDTQTEKMDSSVTHRAAKPSGKTYKFLLHSFCATGHVLPTQAVAKMLIERGHEVRWLCHPSQEQRVVASGATFIPTIEIALVDAKLMTALPASMVITVDNLFGGRVLAQVSDFRRVLKDYQPDCLLNDVLPYGASAVWELGEVPYYATLGVIPMYLPKTVADESTLTPKLGDILSHPQLMLPCLNEQREQLGLKKLESSNTLNYSPLLHIQASCPSLEFQKVGEKNLQVPQVHYVGPLVTAGSGAAAALPEWWDEVETATRVIGITQGTLATDPTSLLIPAIQALQNDQHLLLVVPSPFAEKIRSTIKVNANVRIAEWVPYDKLLPLCDLLVTNGGYGSVTQALSHGVPLVCAGVSEDKKDTAERVTWLGAGIDLKTDNPTEQQIKEAVYEILKDKKYRESAVKVAKELGTMGGAEKVCVLLEEGIELAKAANGSARAE